MAIAKWYKIDFHTHTPASECFPDKRVTAEKWLEKAKQSGMNAVVVTDHNSVGFIEEIEKVKGKYEKDNEFKVFYGIELCVSADFTHMLIIFDDKMSVTEIEDAVISDLGLKRNDWANTEINVTEDKLKDLCMALKNRIFVIPAHFASNKGLGKCNINAIKKYQEFIEFSAIEVRTEEDEKEYKNKLSQKVINSAVAISGSDNPDTKNEAQHSVEGFGKMFTWVKMANLNFEGLKQVFIDPEHRCLNWLEISKLGEKFNPNDINFNYLAGVKLNGIKHMTDMNLRFSPHLNCIVGGRGTGKSTLVNALNYGLNPSLELSKCKLLDKTIKQKGTIDIFFNFGSNNPYQITSVRDKKELSFKYENMDGIINEPPEFKVDFYGQKEIFNLVEDEEDININPKSPLVKLIDDKIGVNLNLISDDINNSLTAALQLSETYKSNKKKINELATVRAEIEKSTALLIKFQESGLEKARKEYDEIKNFIDLCKKEILNLENYLSSNSEQMQIRIDELETKIETMKKLSISDDKTILQRVSNIYGELKESIESKKTILLDIQEALESGSLYSDKKLKEIKYQEALVAVNNTGSENIREIQDRLEDNKKREKELEEIQGKQVILKSQIEENILKFIKARLLLSEKRRKTVNSLEIDNITIEIEPIAHKSRWKQSLQKELGRENIFDADFNKLSEVILSQENNYEMYKKFLMYLLLSEDGKISILMPEIADARFEKLWIDKWKGNTLNSLAKIIPEDFVRIKMIDEDTEININEGSPGQKSAAALSFILSSGENPLIIDQPEDDLDNSLIYNLIVKSIRKMKNKRQIIIVTHNPNIPVLGDAEGIIILDRNAEGKVDFRKKKKTGCLDEGIIREGLCEIMEGGEGAFRKREEKYLYK